MISSAFWIVIQKLHWAIKIMWAEKCPQTLWFSSNLTLGLIELMFTHTALSARQHLVIGYYISDHRDFLHIQKVVRQKLQQVHSQKTCEPISGLILSLRPANERWRYFVKTSLIGWVQAWNQLCIITWNHTQVSENRTSLLEHIKVIWWSLWQWLHTL